MRELARLPLLLTAVAVFVCAPVAQAAGPCDGFAWNVQHERMLFATQPQDQKTGGAVAAAPLIVLETLYRLALVPQKRVAFAFLPGRKTHAEGAYAGLVRLHIAASGLYRVALSARYDATAQIEPDLPPLYGGCSQCTQQPATPPPI